MHLSSVPVGQEEGCESEGVSHLISVNDLGYPVYACNLHQGTCWATQLQVCKSARWLGEHCVSTLWCPKISALRTFLRSRALCWAVSIRATGRRRFIKLLFCGILLLGAFAWLDFLFSFCATNSPLNREQKYRLNFDSCNNPPKTLGEIWTWELCGDTVKAHTSSSLSDVSESVEAAGLLTGSSCSPESTLFLLARDKSS